MRIEWGGAPWRGGGGKHDAVFFGLWRADGIFIASSLPLLLFPSLQSAKGRRRVRGRECRSTDQVSLLLRMGERERTENLLLGDDGGSAAPEPNNH